MKRATFKKVAVANLSGSKEKFPNKIRLEEKQRKKATSYDTVLEIWCSSKEQIPGKIAIAKPCDSNEETPNIIHSKEKLQSSSK